MWKKISDALDRFANPLLVREMYRSLHSKKFLGSIWILLLAALLSYVIVYVNYQEGEPCGGVMFTAFSAFSYLVVGIVVPYLVHGNLREEVESGTIELIHITRMHARQQIRGRVLGALVKLGLLFSVVGPFAAAAFLFKGVSVEAVFLVLYVLFLVCVGATTLAIFFGSLASIDYLRTISRWAYLVVLVATLFFGSAFLQFISELSTGRIGSWSEVVVAVMSISIIGLLLCWFLCAASANMLTFEANKSSARTKLILLLMLLTGFGLYFGLSTIDKSFHSEGLIGVSVLGSIALGVCTLWWISDRKRIPHSMREKLTKGGWMLRLIHYPFTDGAGGGAAFLFLGGALIMGGIGFASLCEIDDLDVAIAPILVAFAYVLYLSACTRAVLWLLPPRHKTAAVQRGTLLTLVVVHAIIAVLWASLAGVRRGYDFSGPIAGLFPFTYFFGGEFSLDELPDVVESISLALISGLVAHLFIVLPDLGDHLEGKFE